ncbi:TPA_asm: hypothetical protein G3287_002528 [Salmonella enterica subsp. enterica serovar Java]|nr:hypothetical protein [Salmonella enterica subsp. enterica serovar Java]
MKFLKRGVALALLAAFALTTQPAQAYEKDKTYKITILHTNWICPYISRHLLSLNPLLACCRRYSRGER